MYLHERKQHEKLLRANQQFLVHLEIFETLCYIKKMNACHFKYQLILQTVSFYSKTIQLVVVVQLLVRLILFYVCKSHLFQIAKSTPIVQVVSYDTVYNMRHT